jgi:hypothetical protein
MKRTRSRLIRALSLAALMAAMGTVAALWTQARRDQAQNALDQARDSRLKVNARLQTMQDQKARLMRAQLRLEALGKRGVLGTGKPAEWAQNLARTRRELGLAEFASAFAPPPPSGQPGPELCASSLTIKTRLRHEGEFLRLIAALQADAIVLPRRCSLERQAGETPAITAECELDWVTLDLRPVNAPLRIPRKIASDDGAPTRRPKGPGSL